MEHILVMDRSLIPIEWLPEFGSIKLNQNQFITKFNNNQLNFKPRITAEANKRYKQVIPYAVLQDEQGALLCYPRQGSENRLHNLYSVGIGGHINDARDRAGTLWQTILRGLRREIKEETGLNIKTSELHFCGIINEERTSVGKVHWGLVFLIRITQQQKEQIIPSPELNNYNFCAPHDFLQNKAHEYWSALALDLIKLRN